MVNLCFKNSYDSENANIKHLENTEFMTIIDKTKVKWLLIFKIKVASKINPNKS